MKILQHRDVLSVVLAGGMGERLFPLTRDRAKPAVPFGGRYRIIDFVLNNFVNSGFTKIKVLTQFKSNSLIEHIIRTWRLSPTSASTSTRSPRRCAAARSGFAAPRTPCTRTSTSSSTRSPTHVCVFGGDHIYKMDVNPMLAFHEDGGARPHDRRDSRCRSRRPRASASSRSTADGRIVGFEEKPKDAARDPRAARAWRSRRWATTSSARASSSRRSSTTRCRTRRTTSARTIIPALLAGRRRASSRTTSRTNRVPGAEDLAPYWRDVGTVDSYWDASMDLISVTPPLNLYNPKWPIKSHAPQLPPAKFVFADAVSQRIGIATDSLGRVGLHHLGRHDPPLDPLPAREDQLLLARRGVRPDGRRRRGALRAPHAASSSTRA